MKHITIHKFRDSNEGQTKQWFTTPLYFTPLNYKQTK